MIGKGKHPQTSWSSQLQLECVDGGVCIFSISLVRVKCIFFFLWTNGINTTSLFKEFVFMFWILPNAHAHPFLFFFFLHDSAQELILTPCQLYRNLFVLSSMTWTEGRDTVKWSDGERVPCHIKAVMGLASFEDLFSSTVSELGCLGLLHLCFQVGNSVHSDDFLWRLNSCHSVHEKLQHWLSFLPLTASQQTL